MRSTGLAAQLGSPEVRQLAYELAVGLCDADDLRTAEETRFLAELGAALGLSEPQMAEPVATADALATAPLDEAADAEPLLPAATPGTAAAPSAAGTAPPVAAPSASGPIGAISAQAEAELDRTILDYAILTGALELLPQSISSSIAGT